MKKALITGIRGQDGAYLAELLLKKGYQVIGADRRSGESTLWRLKELGIEREVEMIFMDLLEFTNIFRTIDKYKPDEVYNLAAQSFVGVSFEQPVLTSDVNAMGTVRLLDILKTLKPDVRFYQASTSEMFGKAIETPQTEETGFAPRSPYGFSKVFAHWATVNYRESYRMFNCSGILFNHESPLRGLEFVTRKISDHVAKMKYGLADRLVLGNLDAKRDWGFAKEFVEAMWLMLQQDEPEDYVIATGENHSVREFVEHAFAATGIQLAWQGEGVNEKGINKKTSNVVVEVSDKFYRPADVEALIGNPGKAKEKLGWEAKTKFKDLVGYMVEADLNRVSNIKTMF
jgi:GDPmannose 4,6-dehydratase